MRNQRTGVVLGMAAVALAAVFLSVTSAQTLGPDEVRITSRPYFPPPAIRVESQLVQLEVVVRDPRGRAVCGLTKEDFAVRDSGKGREVSAFSVEVSTPAASNSPRPARPAPQPETPSIAPPQIQPGRNSPNIRWIALVFDDLNTPTADLGRAKIAARRFIREAVGSGDRVGIFTTSGAKTLEFSGDTAAVLAAVATVESHQRAAASGLTGCPRITAYEAYHIVNGDVSVTQVKVEEACRCSGAAGCDASPELMTPGQFTLPTSSSSGDRGDPYGGGPLVPVIVSVQSQARQTWEQARQASQVTLEAIRAALDQLRRAPGRRMVVLASSGFLSATLDEEQDAIIDEAVRAGVVISSLDAKGLYAEAPGRPIDEPQEEAELPVGSTILQIESLGDRLDSVDSAMARFAESTGGQFFRNNNDLDFGFYQLGVMPACTYLMGFPPAEDGEYHKIKVQLSKKSRDFLEFRPGYFARKKAPPAQPPATGTLEAEVAGSDERTDLRVASSETPGNVTSTGRQLTIRTHVEVQGVSFHTQKDRRVQKLAFVAVLFAPDGRWVVGKEAVMDLTLKPESYERLLKSGISGMMTLEAAPGAYRLRIVVQEGVDGKMSATSKELRIPQA